jgi:hypothetical protein
MEDDLVFIFFFIYQFYGDVGVKSIPRTPVFFCVAVEDLFPGRLAFGIQFPVPAHHRGKVEDHKKVLRRVLSFAAIDDHALIPVLKVRPFETELGKLVLVERGFGGEQSIEIPDTILQ